MKEFIQNILRNTLGLEIRRVKYPKEYAIPLIKTNAKRLIYFYDLLNQLSSIDGDIVECGVGSGHSLFAFSASTDLFEKKRHIYGFDSFEGFPEPSKQDTPEKIGIKKGQYATTEDAVKRYLVYSGVSLDFIGDRITFVKGFFNETLITYSGIGIALLHLDVALYQSYKDCLETLYPKVVKGGIIAFDEYQETKYNGATKAIDEFIEGKETIIKSSIIDCHYLVKSI